MSDDWRTHPAIVELFGKLHREGRIRRGDDEALMMLPLDDDESGELSTTHIACGNCGAFVEVEHRRPIGEVSLSPCPLCGVSDWRETDRTSGVCHGGHLSAPRIDTTGLRKIG